MVIFADDTADAAQSEDIHQAIQYLQEAINRLSEWFNKLNIHLNPTNCEAQILTLTENCKIAMPEWLYYIQY